MVLCELTAQSFLATWTFITVGGLLLVLVLAGYVFQKYYVEVTYEKWRYKTNPNFPPPEKVRDEIIQTIKGVTTATLCPTISIWLAMQGKSNAYCGIQHGWLYELKMFGLIWIMTDFFEFFYHWCGHRFAVMWQVHCHHHAFYNPTPFSVIADEWFDQFWRASPFLFFPLVFDVNIELMLLQYLMCFYVYGIYLHWGYEMEWPDAHHPIVNSSFQHYIHHARSIKNKPYHCGFFLKIWDQLFDSMYPEDRETCPCAKCSRERGLRSEEAFKKIDIPDYKSLLNWDIWMKGFKIA